MNKKFLIFLFFYHNFLIYGSDHCFTSQTTNPETGIVTTHVITHIQCSCPCTAQRENNGTCYQCGHKVIEQ